MNDETEDNPDVAAARSQPTVEAHASPVLVFDAPTVEEAEVVCATLNAAGVPAFLDHVIANPVVGAVDSALGGTWRRGVYVAPSNVEAARSILTTPPPTDDELAEAAQADGTTLQEAERHARES